MDYEDKKRIFEQYIEALEEERQKMQVFHRELPLALHLVSQAIDGYRQQMTSELFLFGRSHECEETSSDGQPVLEEFIPLKRGSSSYEKEEEEGEGEGEEEEEITNERSGKKPDWLRSVQLWNQEPDPPSNEESSRKPAAVDEMMMMKKKKKVGGAFHPFHGEKNTSKPQAAATSSTAETRRREEKDGRKARRCWSPELHRRFLQALQQLGGPHVATPKQIKELMKVDGLTNDEVKSHLQKYRLHNRRPLSAAVQGCGGGSTTEPTSQLFVVGGIWMPPPEYAVAAKATDTTTKIYAPVPTMPQLSPSLPHKQKQTHRSPTSPLQWKGGRGTLEEDHAKSSSRTTSSSSHTTTTTTTTSPPF